jgi:hypothetical protein
MDTLRRLFTLLGEVHQLTDKQIADEVRALADFPHPVNPPAPPSNHDKDKLEALAAFEGVMSDNDAKWYSRIQVAAANQFSLSSAQSKVVDSLYRTYIKG